MFRPHHLNWAQIWAIKTLHQHIYRLSDTFLPYENSNYPSQQYHLFLAWVQGTMSPLAPEDKIVVRSKRTSRA